MIEENIPPEQRENYKSIRDNFHKERNERITQINDYNSEIKNIKGKVSDLEKEVNDLRPRIDGCDKHIVCKNCDIYSMKYLGSSPNPDKYFFYECVICGFEDQHT